MPTVQRVHTLPGEIYFVCLGYILGKVGDSSNVGAFQAARATLPNRCNHLGTRLLHDDRC